MPVPPKRSDKRVRTNTRTLGIVAQTAAIEAPEAPGGLLKATQTEWSTYWSSPAAALVMAQDIPSLERLFTLKDERRRCLAATRKQRVVTGSMGQPVVNPLAKHLLALDAAIDRLEAAFGITPMGRLRLGAQFGEARRSLADLNAAAELDDDDRFMLIDAEATDAV
jgi:hypothetical protein